MKIAVTYENGQVFQHFGRCESFKIYEVEGNNPTSWEVVETNCQGHEAMVSFLRERDIDVVICGGIGDEAVGALYGAGIQVISGISGAANDAVIMYLQDSLESEGANCAKDDEEGCGCGCSGGCGGGCSGGCGGCAPQIEGRNVGKKVKVHYRGTLNDGSQFDSSYDRGEPLEFICGSGMMIRGFDIAVAEMEVGQVVNVHLMPEEAYGESNPNAIFTVPLAQMPGTENLEVGAKVVLSDMFGRQIPATVTAKDAETITFDTNHEMAGKELNFEIELVEVEE